jgi:hypothetical protein
MRGYLAAAERRAVAPDAARFGQLGQTDGDHSSQRSGNGRPGGGARAGGVQGAMGSSRSRAESLRRFALPKREPDQVAPAAQRALADPQAAERGLEEARQFGMIGLLEARGDHAPTPAFGEIEARGPDAIAAVGAMWGRALGEHAGSEALGLSGVGLGGGGSGMGVGLDRLGTVGHMLGPIGPGTGGGGARGIGSRGRSGTWSGARRARPPRVYFGNWYGSVLGRLPPEAIQRIVRQNFGRFRACYETGLRQNPALSGRVTVRFVIGRDGAVANVADSGSDLPDRQVASCVIRAFYGLSFPQPEDGIVTVVYPLVLSPDG